MQANVLQNPDGWGMKDRLKMPANLLFGISISIKNGTNVLIDDNQDFVNFLFWACARGKF